MAPSSRSARQYDRGDGRRFNGGVRNELDDSLPCRQEFEFYDRNTGLCGLCEDICRPHHMDMTECKYKCSKYYRNRFTPSQSDYAHIPAALLTTTLATGNSIVWGISEQETNQRLASSAGMERQASSEGGSGLLIIMLVVVFVSIALTTVVTLGVIFLCTQRRRMKARTAMESRSRSESSESKSLMTDPNKTMSTRAIRAPGTIEAISTERLTTPIATIEATTRLPGTEDDRLSISKGEIRSYDPAVMVINPVPPSSLCVLHRSD